MFSAEWEKFSPSQVKWPRSVSTEASTVMVRYEKLTVDVADVLVEVDLRVVPLAIDVPQTSPQDMAVIDADVLRVWSTMSVYVLHAIRTSKYLPQQSGRKSSWMLGGRECIRRALLSGLL
jgi:hypothetical protein